MAENNRVQLTREEIVGNEVVLTDINPITDTASVDDISSGQSLDLTLERVWNIVNNKLSRIVNSVNGRTGVVVLTAEDVGLGNVDNVSLADIKKWVIQKIKEAFKTHRLQLFQTIEEVVQFCDEHDESYASTPFYSEHGRDGDMKSYIGYFYWDEVTQSLDYEARAINTVGWTDNSIVYDEKLDDERDFSNGGLGVNIWKYEEALEIYNDALGGKKASGLRLNKSLLTPKLYYYNSLFGINDNGDGALIYRTNADPSDLPTDTKIVKFYFNDQDTTEYDGVEYPLTLYLVNNDLKYGDLIVCNFSDDFCYTEEHIGELKPGIPNDLVKRQTCIGMVTYPMDASLVDQTVHINFRPIRPNVGNGLVYEKTDVSDAISIKSVCSKPNEIVYEGYENITTFGESNSFVGGLKFPAVSYYKSLEFTSQNLPSGPLQYQKPDLDKYDKYFNLNLDNSLEILPYRHIDDYITDDGTSYIENMFTNYPDKSRKLYLNDDGNHSLPDNEQGRLGIHLASAVENYDSSETINDDPQTLLSSNTFKNISGLKIVSSKESVLLNENANIESGYNVPKYRHTGGLMVNTGKFLDITPGETKDGLTFYDGGKVNVRIDPMKGIQDVGDNKLGVQLYGNDNTPRTVLKNEYKLLSGGLAYIKDGDKTSIGIDMGMGLRLSKYELDGSHSADAAMAKVAVNIIDKTCQDDFDTIKLDDPVPSFGGLRYTTLTSRSEFDTHYTTIGIRVNESDETTVDNTQSKRFRVGSEGLCITDTNVLGIQLYKKHIYAAAGGDGNGLVIDNDMNALQPGLRINYEIKEGLDISTHNDFYNKLKIKIYDVSASSSPVKPTAGETVEDIEIGGADRNGLRLIHNGFLGIRINDNGYNGEESYTSAEPENWDEDTGIGTKGLCIDKHNVLGVQVDGSSIVIKDGKVSISDEYKKSGADMNIIYDVGGIAFKYNGEHQKDLHLGPGLILTND